MNIYFSENLKKLRKERELTQEALADFLGVTFQAISKWERGEGYPDITTLPVISSFFGVSLDELFGVNQAKNEDEILSVIDKFDNGKYNGTDGALEFVSKAYKDFPNDYRIVVRYMHVLINNSLETNELLKHKKEIVDLYNRIQNCCTNDRIRIYAKNLLIHYYKPLTRITESKITENDMYELIDTMPYIKDSKEVLMSYMPINEENIKQGCRNLIDELICIFGNTVTHYSFYYDLLDTAFTDDKVHLAIEAMELLKDVFNLIYTDKNYGTSWRIVIYTYGHLGELYHRIGDYEKAYKYLKECALLSKRFDTMPNITTREALFFEGTRLNKQEDVAVYLDTSVCDQMKRYMLEKYNLSKEFKETQEFKSIIEILS